MKSRYTLLAALLLVGPLYCAGCASVFSRSVREPALGFPPYCGIQTDFDGLSDELPLPILAFIDLPFSFALDTLLLPFDVIAGVAGTSAGNCGRLSIAGG